MHVTSNLSRTLYTFNKLSLLEGAAKIAFMYSFAYACSSFSSCVLSTGVKNASLFMVAWKMTLFFVDNNVITAALSLRQGGHIVGFNNVLMEVCRLRLHMMFFNSVSVCNLVHLDSS